MVEYSKVNVKLTDTQLKKQKPAVKDKTGTTLRMSFKMLNRNDLPHELLLTARQKRKLINACNNNMSTDLKLSRAQISKIIQSGGFLGRLIGPLIKSGLPLIRNVIKPLAKSVLIPLGLTAAASAADAGIRKKILGFDTTTLIISNEEMNDTIKIAQGTLGANLLGNLLAGKEIVRAGSGRPSSSILYENKKGKGIVRAGSGNKKGKEWDC